MITQKYFQQGISMLEVLLSLVLVSLILLGFDACQLVALRATKNTWYSQIALTQMNNMLAIIQTTSKEYANYFAGWNAKNSILLPNGKGEIVKESNELCVSISWLDAQCRPVYLRNCI